MISTGHSVGIDIVYITQGSIQIQSLMILQHFLAKSQKGCKTTTTKIQHAREF